MEILVLSSSPRKNGITSQAVKNFVDGVRAAGAGDLSMEEARVNVLNVNDLDFSPCKACLFCRKHGNCCQPVDDAHRVAELIRACDVLVVAAPVYWGNIPGTLKTLFDRLVYVLMGETRVGIPIPKHKGKSAYVITSCTTPFPFNVLCGQSTGVFKALKEILGTAGFKIRGKMAIPGTRKMQGLPERYGRKAREMGRNCASR
jgi:multimeric flavodoxin WrbA